MLMFDLRCNLVDDCMKSLTDLPGMKVTLSYRLLLQPFGCYPSILAINYQRRMMN